MLTHPVLLRNTHAYGYEYGGDKWPGTVTGTWSFILLTHPVILRNMHAYGYEYGGDKCPGTVPVPRALFC